MAEMTREAFEALIRKAETEAEHDPSGYRRRVGLFAALGYGYVLGLVATGLAGIALLVWVFATKDTAGGNAALAKLAILFMGFGWLVLSALRVRIDPPKGWRITREDFPDLFAEIDDLQDKLDTVPIHEVVLVPDLNAFVAQTPRLGVLGWHRNTLGIGLEMMLVLDRDEMRAVLAHELGHLSGNHSRFGAWIYRIRRTWTNLMETFREDEGWAYLLVKPFFKWYVPRFDAYSFALRRMNEYEADAASAELTSADTAARALVKVNVFAPWIERVFWNDYHAGATERPAPEALAYTAVHDRLAALDLPPETLDDLRLAAMGRATGYADTHPALADRLRGLGRPDATLDYAALDFTRSAAHDLFGARLGEVLARFDAEWWESAGPRWRERFETVEAEKNDLAALQAEEYDDLSDDELWRLGTLAQRWDTTEAGIDAFRAFQARHPQDGDVAMVLGRLLARVNDPACIAEWAKVPRAHREFVRANDEAAIFLDAQGRHEEAAALRAAADARHAEVQTIRADHAQATTDDTYAKPGISDANLAWLRDRLAGFPLLKQAWLAEKVRESKEGMPIYVLAVQPKFGGHMQVARMKSAPMLKDQIAQSLGDAHTKDDPMHLFICEYEPLQGGLAAKVKKAGDRIT